MSPYIDIHTHQIETKAHVFKLFNFIVGRNHQQIKTPCSVGIHPRYIEADFKQQYQQLILLGQQDHVLAIGECGLDKKTNTDWELQLQAFEMQIQFANKLQKPLIIHCVRAYQEVIACLKQQKAQVPIVFHGVNKKQTLIESLLQQGYWISLGAFILQGQHDDVIQNIDLSRFFLETDDKSTDIVEIYSYFCRVRKISEEQLKQQLIRNVSDVFTFNVLP